MASPAWFFSTIAQAVAAIIGLTIAFTVSTHLSRRERRQRRTDEARREWLDLKQQYQPVLDSISQAVRSEVEVGNQTARYELTDISEATEWAEKQNSPTAAKVWALSSGASQILSTLSLLNSVGTRDQIEILQRAIKELEYGILYRGMESNKRLYTEITGKEPEDAEGHYYFDEILDSHGRVGAWLDRNRTAREENLAGATPDDLSGSNMFSLVTIFEMMENDLTEVGLLTVETDVTADFLTANFARGVILSCLKLALWGIFLPSLFLISPSGIEVPLRVYETLPNWISGYEWVYHSFSIAIQVVILLAVTFYTLRLFLIMLIDISTAVPTMENLLSNSNTNKSGSSSRDHDGQAGSSWSKRSMTYLFKWVFSGSIVHSNEANLRRRKD